MREDTDDQRRWRDLVARRLPQAARSRPDWPVRHDHCFSRILLDNACGGPWRESVPAPAWANISPARLGIAIALGEAVLASRADLALLNRRSLAWRGKTGPSKTGPSKTGPSKTGPSKTGPSKTGAGKSRAGKAFSGEPRPACAPARLSEGALTLRRWTAEDEQPLAALHADPEVMRHFPTTKDRRQSVIEARSLDRRFEADGFGPWAVEIEGEGFLGFVGAMRVMRPMPFIGGDRPGSVVEIGWRLARSAWGRGIATRAARLALADLFGRCGIPAVVAFTALCNAPSRRVMGRLGMSHAEDFAHPALPPGDRLRPHALYRLSACDFFASSFLVSGEKVSHGSR